MAVQTSLALRPTEYPFAQYRRLATYCQVLEAMIELYSVESSARPQALFQSQVRLAMVLPRLLRALEALRQA